MNNYIEIIKIAIMTFPFIALIISLPFILIQYHKYGSISFFKTIIIYSFTLYFICAYFLVILPLPDINEVANLTTPRMQLIPFSFIVDFIKNTSFNINDIHTYLPTLKESYFYVPIYNIFLTLPFGIYLRYYFKCNGKKVAIYTFLLSLFYELTQLSGLYFIYPRSYRLFDVDDLLLNTLGGLVGYFIAKPIINKLPTIEKIESDAKEKGKKISGFKRTTSLFLDFFLYSIMSTILYIIFSKFTNSIYLMIISVTLYYFLIPIVLKCQTLGQKYLNLKIVDDNDKENILRLFYRNILFIIIYFGIPFLVISGITHLNISVSLRGLLTVIFLGIIFLGYIITALKYFFTSKKMIYEKISKTKLVSTIK